jgi:hypothetical protein
VSSTESFVFSFENDQDIHNMRIGRVTNTTCSVYDGCNYNGFFSFGDILFINGQKIYAGYNNCSYENIFSRRQAPIIEEIEVFSVAKK